MLRSIYEGYIPTAILSAIGYFTIAPDFLVWFAFFWIFGAVLTVAVGYIRTNFRLASNRST